MARPTCFDRDCTRRAFMEYPIYLSLSFTHPIQQGKLRGREAVGYHQIGILTVLLEITTNAPFSDDMAYG
jgi:hypothetical protein